MKYLVLALCMSGALMTHPAVADIKGFSVEEEGKEGVITIGKLMWTRCNLGDTWKNGKCLGNGKFYSWSEANAMAAKYESAGYSDWRLPTRVELLSLRYCSTGVITNMDGSTECAGYSKNPTFNFKGLVLYNNYSYWTSTTVKSDQSKAWSVGFYDGREYKTDKAESEKSPNYGELVIFVRGQ